MLELPFKVTSFKPDSSVNVEANGSIILSPNYYQVETDMIWNEMYTSFNYDLYMNEQGRSDTLFLQTARFYGPMVLHADPEQFKHYCCSELCNGLVEDIDSKGTTRFKGKFRKGKPTGNLKYYNSSGELIRTEVYSEGQLQRIK